MHIHSRMNPVQYYFHTAIQYSNTKMLTPVKMTKGRQRQKDSFHNNFEILVYDYSCYM